MLGVAFGPQSLASAKQFQGSLAQIKATSEGATIQLTAGLLPAINQISAGMLTEVTGKTSA
jgi:hypothetical protein